MEVLTFYIVIAMILLFLSILGTAIAFLAYSGLFHKVEVGAGQPPFQEIVLAYHFGRGAYRNCGYYFSELTSLAPTLKTLGIYYDDPQQVEQESLRWAVGCIIAKDSEKPNEELQETLQKKGYKFITLPPVTSVVRAKFPNNTFLSFFLGIYRVYPALARYIQDHKLCAHPFIEMYDESEIHFMVPLARQSEFYVPESLMEDEEEWSDGVHTDLSSDDTAPEKTEVKKVVDQQPEPSAKLPSASSPAVSSVVESTIMRDSFDRDTPVATSVDDKKEERTLSAQTAPAAEPTATGTTSHASSPTNGGAKTPEGGSSSEVDSESYEVVKAEDVSKN